GVAARDPGAGSLGGGFAQAGEGGHDDDLRDRVCSGPARARSGTRLATAAAARDRRDRRLHPLEPPGSGHSSGALLLARPSWKARGTVVAAASPPIQISRPEPDGEGDADSR